MGARRVVKSLIYGILLGLFIYLIIHAFDNLLAEKTARSSQRISTWKMPITMPSMTICPMNEDEGFEAKDILEEMSKYFDFNISASYGNDE